MSLKYGWAKGTGFGYSGETYWDPHTWTNEQKSKDEEICKLCKSLTEQLSVIPPPSGVVSAIQKSCLLPFIKENLKNDSFLDMELHENLYMAIFHLCAALSQHRQFAKLFYTKQGGKSLVSMLGTHKTQAELVQKLVAEAKKAKDSKKDECEKALSFSSVVIVNVDKVKKNLSTEKAVNVGEVKGEVQQCLSRLSEITGLKPFKNGFIDFEKPEEAKDVTEEKAEKKGTLNKFKKWLFGSEKEPKASPHEMYVSVLEPLKFDSVESFTYHKYSGQANFQPTGKWMKRVAHEYSDLASSSPVTHDSSVFFRINEERMSLAQFLITAPSETPYAYGCFVFDVFFPLSYPNSPPQVNLQTTGGGTVRFNPNLYEDGMVCLSLLGTWQGDGGGESWGVHSTILQVLISLQSLIFVPEPYFNEPGYESEIGSESGKSNSEQYNSVIREGTMSYAILEMIRSPPKEFKAVIEEHFVIRKKEILQTTKEWADNAHLTAIHNNIKTELDKLEKRLGKEKKKKEKEKMKLEKVETEVKENSGETVDGVENPETPTVDQDTDVEQSKEIVSSENDASGGGVKVQENQIDDDETLIRREAV